MNGEEERNAIWLIIGICGLVLVVVVYYALQKRKQPTEEQTEEVQQEYLYDYDQQIETLTQQICSLQDQNDLLAFEIEELYSVIERERFERTELKHIYNLTDEEKELLARLVKCEAGSEPFECKICVCVVVLNRITNSKFKDNLTDVIYSPGQFTPAESGKLEEAKPTADCYFAVESALSLTYNEVNESYGTELLFFRAATEEKVWGVNTKFAFTIGKTDFYTLK